MGGNDVATVFTNQDMNFPTVVTSSNKHFGRMDVDGGYPYIFQVLFFMDRQGHISIDACTTIPAAIRHGRIINFDTNGVFSTPEKPVQANLKRDETVYAASGFLAVDIDFGIAVNSPETQGHMFFQPTIRDLQVLFIMIKAAREVSRSFSGRKIGIALFAQHGIVREIDSDVPRILFRPEGPAFIQVSLRATHRHREDDRNKD